MNTTSFTGAAVLVAILQVTQAVGELRDAVANGVTRVAPDVCAAGVYRQPAGPFGVFVFCDDALGTQIGLVLLQLDNPVVERWSLSNRFWQESKWSSDVRSFAWAPRGHQLFVTTGEVYGSASVWVIEPGTREARRLFSQKTPDVCGMELHSVDADHRRLQVALEGQCKGDGTEVEIAY